MARLPVDGTWRYNPTTKVLTRSGNIVKFSYYNPRPSGIHRAVDVGVGVGNNVRAVRAGRITRLGYDANGWGRYLRYKDVSGHEWLEAHLSSYVNLAVGRYVAEGQVIARSGNTGFSSGPHVHTEYWWVPGVRSSSVDPWQAFVVYAKGSLRITPPYPAPNWSKNFRQGNSGPAVMFIQFALKDYRVDGVFDAALTTKVKAFQKARGISQSGVVGTRTGPLLAKLKR